MVTCPLSHMWSGPMISHWLKRLRPLGSLHTRRWRPKDSRKLLWMECLHGRLWNMFHGLLDANSGKPCQVSNCYGLWKRVEDPHEYVVMAFGLCVKWPLVHNESEPSLGSDGNSVDCHGPCFEFEPLLFYGPNVISGRACDISTWCHVDFYPFELHWSLKPSRSSVKRAWTISNFSTNHMTCISQVKGSQVVVQNGPHEGRMRGCQLVTPLSCHSRRSDIAEVAPSPWMTEGPFSENGNPYFFSSTGEEWRILGEGFTVGLLFLTLVMEVHTFLH